MRNEKVYEWLKSRGFENRLTEHSETIDTVEHAAQQIGCTEELEKASDAAGWCDVCKGWL